ETNTEMRVGDAAVVQRLFAEGRWCSGGIRQQVAEHDDFADAGQARRFEHVHVDERTAHVLTRWMAAAVGDSACRRGKVKHDLGTVQRALRVFEPPQV